MLVEPQIYKPELLPRRGEVVAWLLTGLGWLGVLALIPFGTPWYWAILFPTLLLLSALSISLGNWMDRHTRLLLDATGVAFENGIRRVRFEWGAIVEMQAIPAIWGETIHVVAKTGHFRFNTLGEVKYRGEVRGRTGFARGNEIFQKILKMSRLHLAQDEKGWRRFVRSSGDDV